MPACFPVSAKRYRRNWRLTLAVGLAIVSWHRVPAIGGGIVTSCTEAKLRTTLSGGGTVTFDCDGTIALTNTLIIDHDTILNGTGTDVIISGNTNVRVFQVNTGVTLTAIALTIA